MRSWTRRGLGFGAGLLLGFTMAGRVRNGFVLSVEIGRQENVQITCSKPDLHAPALTAGAFKEAIRVSARDAGLAAMDLPSGAGHDAQNVARFAPMGMIFIPSRGGVSHSPLEYSSPEQIANGGEVFYRAVLRLDEQLDEQARTRN